MENIEIYNIDQCGGLLTVDYGFTEASVQVCQQITRESLCAFAIYTRANIIDVFQGGTWIDEVVTDVETLISCNLRGMVLQMLKFHLL